MWQSIINWVTDANAVVNGIVWGWPVIILILGTGLLLSIRTGFLQVCRFGNSMNTTIVPVIRSLGKKSGASASGLKTVSQFEAFSTAISGTVGTGNIVGVTAAILTGGPGAVLWMWISAFFGMVTNYSENVLGLFYRKKDEAGTLSGGAFYYIENGLKCKGFLGKLVKILAYLAAVFCLFAAVGMSGVQTNKISGTLSNSLGTAFGVTPGSNAETLVKLLIGIIIAILAAVIIIGGIKRIGKVAAKLVPVIFGIDFQNRPAAFGGEDSIRHELKQRLVRTCVNQIYAVIVAGVICHQTRDRTVFILEHRNTGQLIRIEIAVCVHPFETSPNENARCSPAFPLPEETGKCFDTAR